MKVDISRGASVPNISIMSMGAIPFGPQLVERNRELLVTPPESLEWQREAKHYNINAIFVPLGRYNGLHLFPVAAAVL